MATRDEIEQRLREFFANDAQGALAAYLFGSTARGTAGADSDVDVAVLFGRPRPTRLDELPVALENDLAAWLGARVDVVVLDGAPSDLVHRVLRDGRVVLDRDRSARIAFEVRARNDYFDLMPVRAQYRRYPARLA